MKKITKCLGCPKVIGIYKSYKAHLTEFVKSPLTGEVKEVEYTGRICPTCATNAGYKIGKKKKEE
jgi:hypothetical protein